MIFLRHNRLWLSAKNAGWILFVLFWLNAMTSHAGKVLITFKQNKTVFKSNELASNMLRITNGSEKQLNFYLSLNLPEGWHCIKSMDMLYHLPAGDSLFIPIKLGFKGREEGNISYLVTANLLSEANRVQFASTSWYLQIETESEWSASVDRTESYFINNTDTSSFNLNIRNTGNSTEIFTVKLFSHFQLQALTRETMTEAPAFFNITMPPQTDTTFQFVVKSKPQNNESYRTPNNQDYSSQSNEKYPMKIQVQSHQKDNSVGRTWKSVVDFKRNSSEMQFHEFSRLVLPLTAELRLDNLMEPSTALNLNLYGHATLSRSRSLIYRYQSFFSNQYLDQKSFKGNYHYLGYFTPKYNFEIGNITGWGNFGFTPSGRGAKGEYLLGRHKVGLIYLQNPDLFLGVTNRTAGIHDEISFTKFSLNNYYQQSWNDFNKVNGKLFITGADFRIRRQHIFSTRIGSSSEDYYGAINPFTKNGIGGSFNYSGTVRDFNLRFSTNYGSKYYTGYRGISNLNYGITYKQSSLTTWTFTNSFYRQNPVYFDPQGNELNMPKSRSDKYELRYSIMDRANNYSFRAAYYDDDLLNIHYKTRGVGFDYHPVSKSEARFASTVFASYIKLMDYTIPDYFTAQIRTSFRYKSLTSNIRYNYGPYQAFEQITFEKYRINPQSIYVNSYYGFWIMPNMISLEPSLNYSYETLYKRDRLSIRPELFYFSKSGWQFNIYTEYILNSQQIATLDNSKMNSFATENSQESTVYKDLLVGVGMKRQFGIPLPGKKYCTILAVIFKDLNGNGKQDKNEEALENVLINLKPMNVDSANSDMVALNERGEEVISDKKGKVTFRNLPQGTYKIFAKPLVESSGWFPGTEQIIMLDKTKEIQIPFSHGTRIMGSIIIDHSVSSVRNKDPEISRIRVTAVDSSGKAFSNLTTNDGRFDLYVPSGEYRVSVNQKAVPDNYELEQNYIPVNLEGGIETYNVSFHLKEKERQVKVKKFNADGVLIEDSVK